MKKHICIYICITLIIMIIPFACNKNGTNKIIIVPLKQEEQNLKLQWNEPNVKGIVKPYIAKSDLSNISNISKINGMDGSDKEIIAKNLFIIKRPDIIFEQPFNIYEKNAQDDIPNFITSDSMLHVYHLMYDSIIKNMEKERLAPELKEFTIGAFNKSIEIYNGINEKSAKHAALKNIAYFGIALKLLELDLPGGIPIEAYRIIDNDSKRVKVRWNSGSSEIFPYYIDYKKYIVKGHYSRETDLKNYFLTMMWYGNTPMLFEQFDKNTQSYKRMDEQIAMSIIMTSQILGDENLRRLWNDIYKITSIYFGSVDDVNIYDMSDIIKVTYGEKIDLNKVWIEDKIKMVYGLAKQRFNLHSSDSVAASISYSNKDNIRQTQFRLMGQIYNLDSDIFNNLTIINDPASGKSRLFPKGLDVPSALGSDKAYKILKEQFNEDKTWSGYILNMDRLRGLLSASNKPDDYSLNNSVFWMLRNMVKPYGPGYPSFMLNDNWNSKGLLTSISAISDARHFSAMKAKVSEVKNNQIYNNDGSDIPGYVEPDVNLYSRMEYMGKYIKSFLSMNDFISTNIYSSLESFIDTASFLKNISVKELENKPITKEEDQRIRSFARELKELTLNAVESKNDTKEWEAVPKVDRNMASVSDAHIYENQVLQTVVGAPDYLYVIVPYNGKLYLTRGSVYSYNEFIQPISRKLDDTDWQNSIKSGKEIEQQMWIKDIIK